MRSPSSPEVDHAPQRAADQALDLDRAAVRPPAGDVALACAPRSRPGASRTRPSASPGPDRPSSGARPPAPRRCRSRGSPPPRSAPSRWRCARSPARSRSGASARVAFVAAGGRPRHGRHHSRGATVAVRLRALVISNMRPDAANPGRGSFVRDQVAALRRIDGLEVELYEFGPGPRALAGAAVELRRRHGPPSTLTRRPAVGPLRRRARPLRPHRLAGAGRAGQGAGA